MSKPERTVVEFSGNDLLQILLEHHFKDRGPMTVNDANVSWTTPLSERVAPDQFKLKLSWSSAVSIDPEQP